MHGSLKKKSDFREVYEQGLKSVGRHVVAFALYPADTAPASSAEEVLVGVVASKKVGNAVRRARAKRVLRAAFRDLRSSFPAGTRVVLVARYAAADSSVRSPRVRDEMIELFRRQASKFGLEPKEAR
jgi:ribonuclease P protein component